MAFTVSETQFTKSIINNEGKLIAFVDLVDNTVLIPDAARAEAMEVATRYGAKRFVFSGDAEGAIQFPRDMVMKTESDLLNSEFKFYVGLEEIEKAFPNKHKFYTETLSALFSGAEFTPAKMEEYQKGAADQFCRFNGEGITPILMVDDSNKIVGAIRLAVVENTAYLSDEMVPMVSKASPEFEERLKILLNKTCHYLKQIGVEQALIRAASGRESIYDDVIKSATGGRAGSAVRVIHGAPTNELNTLKTAALEKATEKLNALQPQPAILPWQQPLPGHTASEKSL